MRFTFPGLGGVPFFLVIKFFITRLQKETITMRSSAIAFSFFLALFPSLIFLFTLIPYLPINNLHQEVMGILKEFLPSSAYETIQTTISDILSNKR